MAVTQAGQTDPTTQMNTYQSYVTMIGDPGAKDESKLQAAQELSENFEVCNFELQGHITVWLLVTFCLSLFLSIILKS